MGGSGIKKRYRGQGAPLGVSICNHFKQYLPAHSNMLAEKTGNHLKKKSDKGRPTKLPNLMVKGGRKI